MENTSCITTTRYRKRRYLVYLLSAIVLFILPFITINDNHLFLLSFEHKKLDLAFISFSMQEMYLMPFLVIILFVGIFFLTTLGGRVWCGWACPQTIFRVIFRDFFQTTLFGLRRSIDNKQSKLVLDTFGKKLKFAFSSLVIIFLCFVASANLLFFFVPPMDFIEHISDPFNHLVLMFFWFLFGGFFSFDILVIKENFCIYMCPYARVQSVLYDNDTIMSVYDTSRGGAVYVNDEKITQKLKFSDPNAECIECEKCVHVCPTHIDIRKGMQLECINCLECADACASVMGKLGKSSLVTWSSPNAIETKSKVKYVRLKTIAYVVVLSICFAMILILGSKKESMLLNINRTDELFIKRSDGIENHYIMLFHNTSNITHNVYFEVLDKDKNKLEDIFISSPKNDFRVKPDSKIKQVVTLKTTQDLSLKDGKNRTIDIIIRAYAIDDPNVSVERKSIFVYPGK